MSRRQDLREYIIYVSAARDMLLKLQTTKFIIGQKKKTLKASIENLFKILVELTGQCDEKQINAINNYCKISTLCVIPKTEEAKKSHLAVVPVEALKKLALNTECNFCMKEGNELKKCELRKILANCGIFGKLEKNECEYKLI